MRILIVLASVLIASCAYGANDIMPIALQFSPTLRSPGMEYWKDLRIPTIDNDGQIAFRAYVDDVMMDGGDNSAYRTGSDGFIARAGQQAPGLPDGARFTVLTNLQINPSGPAAFMGRVQLPDGSEASGIWAESTDRSLRLAVLDGTRLQGAPEGTILAPLDNTVADNALNRLALPTFTVNGHGETAFFGRLDSNNSADSSLALFSEGGGHGLRLVARTGMDVPQFAPGATIYNIEKRWYSTFPLNDQGKTIFTATISGPGINEAHTQGLFLDDPDNGLLLLGRSGQPAPEVGPAARLAWFSSPTLNNAGQMVFIGTHRGDDGSELGQGVWTGTSGNFHLVARTGDPAPGVDATFSRLPAASFNSPLINGHGGVAFTANITGPGVDESNDSGIWAQDADGHLRLVVREGELFPSTQITDDFFFDPHQILLNNRGQVAFLAGGAIWATDVAGKIHRIVGSGDLLPFHHGFTDTPADAPVEFVGISPTTGGEEGLGTSFNDRGELVFYAYSQGNNTGVFLSRAVAIPEPRALALLTVAFLTFRGRRNGGC